MKQASSRSTFHRTELIRTLSGLAVVDVAESAQPIAEQLGQWVGVADALNLYAALNPAPAKAATTTGADAAADMRALEQELAQVRQTLGQALRDADLHKLATQARIPLPRVTPKEGDEGGEAIQNYTADFTPYRRYCLGQQRAMAMAIEPLRAKARTVAVGHSPALQRLAALDAGLEQILGLREGELLAGALRLLEKRFEHLRDTHHATCATQTTADDPEQWMQPGGWLAIFCNELRATLLAELDLRLQPVTGLIASCRTETEPS